MQDLDLTKPSIPKYGAKRMLRITTKDVLERADFRVNICSKKNLSTFITKYLIIGFWMVPDGKEIDQVSYSNISNTDMLTLLCRT